MNFMRKKMNKKGFTLIELVVVIAILGILALVAIPRFTGMRADANESAVISNLRNIQTAAEVYASANNKTITDVDTSVADDLAGIKEALGVTDMPDGPGTTTYSVDAGVATADLDEGIPYPDDGVTSYSELD